MIWAGQHFELKLMCFTQIKCLLLYNLFPYTFDMMKHIKKLILKL